MRQYKSLFSKDSLDAEAALIIPSPASFTPFPASIFCNKIAPYVLHNIPRIPPF